MMYASWNVNSLPVRLEQVLGWFASQEAAVLALQETKVIDEKFPHEHFTSHGYHVVYTGQKTYNGVALVSRSPIQDVVTDLPGFTDPSRRYLAATINGIRVINIYVPNGAAVDSDKYHYKLAWLEALTHTLKDALIRYEHVMVMGDFNIAPTDDDVHDPMMWEGSVMVSTQEREAFNALIGLGFTDSFRLFPRAEKMYSWWDYRAGSFRRNNGLRIDHVLLNQSLVKQCLAADIDKTPRSQERPSDHVPVWVRISGEAWGT